MPESENSDHGNRREDEDPERQPAHDALPGKEDVRGSQAHDRGGHGYGEHGQARQPREDHQDRDGQASEHEAETRQPALCSRALRLRPGRGS